MSFIDRLLRRPSLTGQQRERLSAWQALPEPDRHEPFSTQDFAVVDVESTGLDVYGDQLIAIGAVTVEGSKIPLRRSFYRVLRQDRPSAVENILVHGIGGAAQTGGEDPALVLLDFLEYIGKSTLVGFHARFDDIMIGKAVRKHLGMRFRRQWLDLAWLAPALRAAPDEQSRGLDDWLRCFGIVNYSRHDALADALATAQLFQVLGRRAESAGHAHTEALLEAARSAEWLSRRPVA
jgi:DNA polymerase-3 subunit epsilon